MCLAIVFGDLAQQGNSRSSISGWVRATASPCFIAAQKQKQDPPKSNEAYDKKFKTIHYVWPKRSFEPRLSGRVKLILEIEIRTILKRKKIIKINGLQFNALSTIVCSTLKFLEEDNRKFILITFERFFHSTLSEMNFDNIFFRIPKKVILMKKLVL